MSRSRPPRCPDGRNCGTCWMTAANDARRFRDRRASVLDVEIPAEIEREQEDRIDESGEIDCEDAERWWAECNAEIDAIIAETRNEDVAC